MPRVTRISVYEVVGSPFCVASDDGQKVHDRLDFALKKARRVVLSFHNVSTMTPAFLNAAIGQLYGTLTEKQIRSHLRVEDIEPQDAVLLKRVVETAKLYFQDRHRFDQVFREVLGDDDDDACSNASE